MAIEWHGYDGTLSGTTEVELVPAPPQGATRVVGQVFIFNRDSAQVTLTLALRNGSSLRYLWKGPVPADALFVSNDGHVLDETDKSLVAFLAGAPAATQPDFVAYVTDAR